MQDYILRVLKVFEEYDERQYLDWRTDGEFAPVTFFVICNDLFCWGSADAQEITPDNIDLLEQAYKDASASTCIYGESYGGDLFAARCRKMLPQQAYMDILPADLVPLFEECISSNE